MPSNRVFKIGAATAAAAVGVILAITSVGAHSTPATNVAGKSIVGSIVSRANLLSTPMVTLDPKESELIEANEDKVEAAEAAAQAAAEAAALAAEQAKEAAELAAQQVAAACTTTDQPEDTTEKSNEQTEDTAEKGITEAADVTEDATEKSAAKAEDSTEPKCPEVDQDKETGDNGGNHEHESGTATPNEKKD